jgi:hypothetical protein
MDLQVGRRDHFSFPNAHPVEEVDLCGAGQRCPSPSTEDFDGLAGITARRWDENELVASVWRTCALRCGGVLQSCPNPSPAMSLARKHILSFFLLLEWWAFVANPLPFTTFKVSVFAVGAMLVMYLPNIRSVDWTTLETKRTRARIDREESVTSE